MKQYICAFRGRRDYYQVPLALAEQDLLDQFITDFYTVKPLQILSTALPQNWQKKILFRLDPNIPASKVKCLWGTTFLEQARHKLGYLPAKTYAVLDQDFSFAAAARAKATKGDLFLYTPYAWEAFTASYSHIPRKVLFQFHPHIIPETEVLAKDLQRYPFVQKSYQEQTWQDFDPHLLTRIKDPWKYADIILCASTFTKNSLAAVGADSGICHVVPYGIDMPEVSQPSPQNRFQVLFAGSGVQRKGLHHLLFAWQRAKLPKDSLLTLVCRSIDPGIEALVHEIPNVKVVRGMTWRELCHQFETSTLLAMPSLIEGFGQVYLEALSYGCPVLGTANTCLPDLGNETDGVFLAEVANIDNLVFQLERLSSFLPGNLLLRQEARACAEKFSWKQFRSQLHSFL